MYMTKMNNVFALTHFMWSGYVVAAWAGPSGFFCGSPMGCKFDDSCVSRPAAFI